MAKGEKIIVTIGPDGNVKADVEKGPGGAGCVAELLALLSGCGVKEDQINHKREFYAKPVQISQKAKVSG